MIEAANILERWVRKIVMLGEAEWRQRFNNGQYTLKVAGIRQENPDEFIDDFGLSAECGWGRTEPGRLPGLLKAHRVAAEAF